MDENFKNLKNSNIRLSEKLEKYESNNLNLSNDIYNTKKSNKYLIKMNSQLNNELKDKEQTIKILRNKILELKKERNYCFC
jgi:predicted RNase H-like nuclease (RuvC/YqgF family)